MGNERNGNLMNTHLRAIYKFITKPSISIADIFLATLFAWLITSLALWSVI